VFPSGNGFIHRRKKKDVSFLTIKKKKVKMNFLEIEIKKYIIGVISPSHDLHSNNQIKRGESVVLNPPRYLKHAVKDVENGGNF
jgi:hypothetical protein